MLVFFCNLSIETAQKKTFPVIHTHQKMYVSITRPKKNLMSVSTIRNNALSSFRKCKTMKNANSRIDQNKKSSDLDGGVGYSFGLVTGLKGVCLVCNQ